MTIIVEYLEDVLYIAISRVPNPSYSQSTKILFWVLRKVSGAPSGFRVIHLSYISWYLAHMCLDALISRPWFTTYSHFTASVFPPFASQSSQLPSYSMTLPQPWLLANSAAALLLTPALQNTTNSTSCPGLSNPNLSSNSSSVMWKLSGRDLMGMLIEPGMVPVCCNSEGSRTSTSMRFGGGEEMCAFTCGGVSVEIRRRRQRCIRLGM